MTATNFRAEGLAPKIAAVRKFIRSPRLWWIALRSLVFWGFFFVISACLGISLLIFAEKPRPDFRPHRRPLMTLIVNIWMRAALAGLYLICGLKGRIHLPYPWPRTPALIFSRHQSILETLIPLGLPENFVGVTRKEMISIPAFGWLLEFQGHLSIDRNANSYAVLKLLRRAERFIRAGFTLGFYPEGTRRRVNQEVKLRPGAAIFYRHFNLPVLPIRVDTGHFLATGSFMIFPGTFRIDFAEPIAPGLDRHAFEDRLVKAMTAEPRLGTLPVIAILNRKIFPFSAPPTGEQPPETSLASPKSLKPSSLSSRREESSRSSSLSSRREESSRPSSLSSRREESSRSSSLSSRSSSLSSRREESPEAFSQSPNSPEEA